MKISSIIQESQVFENEEMVARNAAKLSDTVYDMLEDIHALREFIEETKLSEELETEVNQILENMYAELESLGADTITETVVRQFRRYGDRFVRHYRCTTGPKEGRLVSEPSACGKRKDPRRVRAGKATARRKKGQRVRKTLFTKRKTSSKRLARLNKVLSGNAGTSAGAGE